MRSVVLALLLAACDGPTAPSDLGRVDDGDLVAQTLPDMTGGDLAPPYSAADLSSRGTPADMAQIASPDLASAGAPPGATCDSTTKCAVPLQSDSPTSGHGYTLSSACGKNNTCCQYDIVQNYPSNNWYCYRCTGTVWTCCDAGFDSGTCVTG